MPPLDSEFLGQLAMKLGGLPKPEEAADRDCSWMTARQIAAWWKATTGNDTSDEDELDCALVEGWETDHRFAELKLRPAKYPSRRGLRRLWGHEDVVGRRPCGTLNPRRCTPPDQFDGIDVPADAKTVFLSHSMLDIEFAERIRNALATRKLRPWLAAEEIQPGELIFESVRAAMNRADATLVLIGRNSLGSAWVDTESAHRVSMFLCNGDDDELRRLLETWQPPGEYDPALIDPLERAYEDAWSARVEGNDVLDGGSGGEFVYKERPQKYRTGAQILLARLGLAELSVYQDGPQVWQGDPAFRDFDDVLDDVLPPR